MFKTIIKETGIVILLLIVTALLLTIVFYEYIPSNKTVPIKIQAYEMSDDIEQELKEAAPSEQNIVETYYIDSADLDLYESTNEYDKGKPNPFAQEEDLENSIDDPEDGNSPYIPSPGKNS